MEINALALPLSVTGLELVRSGSDVTVITGSLALSPANGTLFGENRTHECLSFHTTPRDIHDLAKSFLRTFFDTLEDDILPKWLSFSENGVSALSLKDFRASLVKGKDVQQGICQGAPLFDDRLYTVLELGRGFNMSFYGTDVSLPGPLGNERFCFMIDICQDYGETMFLMIPEKSRDLFDNLDPVSSELNKFGIHIRPFGIGLSMFNHINVHSHTTEMQLWNGDEVAKYK